MRRCVLVGAGPIGDYAPLRRRLCPETDFYLYCDGGLYHRSGLGAAPDLIVGDFDSHPRPELPVETLVLPREKDDTDMVFAAREALRRGFRDFLLLGALGGRLDHSLANLGLLSLLRRQGGRGRMMDERTEVELVGAEGAWVEPDCRYFSLLAPGGARGVQVEGARYPLQDGTLTWDYPYGVSNEVLPGGRAFVRAAEGELLLLRILRED